MKKYIVIFIAAMMLLIVGIYFWKKEQIPKKLQITWNLEVDKISKIVCENSCFSKKQVVVEATEEIHTIVTELKTLSFKYDANIQRQQKNSDGGYCQLLLFLDKNERILDCMEIESNTEVIYSYKVYSYRGIFSSDSKLSKILSNLIAEYWAKPGEQNP